MALLWNTDNMSCNGRIIGLHKSNVPKELFKNAVLTVLHTCPVVNNTHYFFTVQKHQNKQIVFLNTSYPHACSNILF